MFITAILIFYFILSISGTYMAFSSHDKEYKISPDAYSFSLWLMIFFLITFSVIFMKHIITSVFILWFIFDVGSGVLRSLIKGYQPVTKPSTYRRVFNVISGIVSGIGVLYILM